jgi:CheY-like chemotaxis protein
MLAGAWFPGGGMLDMVELGGRKILIVDDVRFTRLTLARMVAALGGPSVVEAENGNAALALLEQPGSKIDCVISDLEMPGLDGLGLLRAIRVGTGAIPRDLPFVVLTGHSEFERLGPALLLDLDAFLIKPVSKSAIEHCLATLIGVGTPRRIALAEVYRALDLSGAIVPADAPAAKSGAAERRVTLRELISGAVLSRDLVFNNGRLLLPAGTRLSDGIAARLIEIATVSGLADEAWIEE